MTARMTPALLLLAALLLPACAQATIDGSCATAPTPAAGGATAPTSSPATHPAGFLEAFEMAVFQAVGEKLAQYFSQIMQVAFVAVEYHELQGRWPTGAADLQDFADQQGEPLDLTGMENLVITPHDHDSGAHISLELHPPGTKDSAKVTINVPAAPQPVAGAATRPGD